MDLAQPRWRRELVRELRHGKWSASYDTASQPTYPGFVEDISFGAGSTVYASASSQVLQSTDNGASWTPRAVAGNVIKAHPTLADTVFVAKGYAGGVAGETFYVSNDGGATFSTGATGLQPNTTYGGEAAFNRIALRRSIALRCIPTFL